MNENTFRNVPVVVKKDEKGEHKQKTVMFEDMMEDPFLSIFSKASAIGPSADLAKGPKDDLLL